MLPGTHSDAMKRNGPEPIISVMAVFGSVLAMRSGIMNGTLLSIFASASMTKPMGCLSTSRKVLASTASSAAV